MRKTVTKIAAPLLALGAVVVLAGCHAGDVLTPATGFHYNVHDTESDYTANHMEGFNANTGNYWTTWGGVAGSYFQAAPYVPGSTGMTLMHTGTGTGLDIYVNQYDCGWTPDVKFTYECRVTGVSYH